MKYLLPALLLTAGSLHAEAPSAELVQILANDHVASDVPFEVKPFNNNEEGVSVTYLVTGENITGFKPNSVIIENLSVSKGTKLPPNLVKRVTFNSFFAKVSPDGTYGRFSVLVPLEHATRVTGLKFKGSIVARISEKTEKTTYLALPPAGAPAITINAFKISRPKIMGNKGWFNITIAGPLQQIKTIIVSSGGAEIKSNGSCGSDDSISYTYPDTGSGQITVQLETWVNLTEVTIPFTFGE